ncbi:hypothetical protein AAT19DRAFT_8516 [Rhodotorula toruloides]|uniref:Major facilitator superfamily (MFS) profile domain-containing protein n=1 Tax=Rhodotorula toruloides TaxID=5286 RepID=A0A2T0AHF9_RHOTO|nr:hypothetical protein AAT19DRAFT_8516 [Rhodotorula toruloides]
MDGPAPLPVIEQQRRPSDASDDAKSSADVEKQLELPAEDGATPAKDPGVARIEALYKVFGKRGTISIGVLYASMILMACGTALDSSTTYTYYAIATSSYSAHSLIGAIDVACAIIASVSRPFLAKIADHVSRPHAYLFALTFYVLGYILIAASKNVDTLAVGKVIYQVGYTGLDLVSTVIIADISPLEWRGFFQGVYALPWVIFAFVSGFITEGLGVGGWRWGYGMFCIITPACVTPALIVLFWADTQAKKQGQLGIGSSNYSVRLHLGGGKHLPLWRLALNALAIIDAVGLVLLGFGFSLVLLPLTLYAGAKGGFANASMIAMLVVGVILLVAFTIWEAKFTAHPLMPRRIWNRTFICCVVIDVVYYLSAYLRDTYFASWVYVIKDWSLRDYTYFTNIPTVGLCTFGVVAGILFRLTRSYKYTQVFGLCVRTLGLGLTVNSASSDAKLVMTQILVSMGGAFSVVGSQVASQASVPHAQDVATAISLLSMLTTLGGAVGSAIAAAVWTSTMPQNLAKKLPQLSSEEIATIFGSITSARDQPAEIRQGVISAYNVTAEHLFIPALSVSFVDIIAGFCAQNYRLGDTQNAIESTKVFVGKDKEKDEKEAV